MLVLDPFEWLNESGWQAIEANSGAIWNLLCCGRMRSGGKYTQRQGQMIQLAARSKPQPGRRLVVGKAWECAIKCLDEESTKQAFLDLAQASLDLRPDQDDSEALEHAAIQLGVIWKHALLTGKRPGKVPWQVMLDRLSQAMAYVAKCK
jgi:hypothetical protein